MSLDVIVCDDSSFARKQLIRTLPKSLVNNLYQAGNGLEAMECLREHKGELLFLDLPMPGMDGYQVLEAIKNERINIMTIVVSADIQPEARKIILSYENVLEFIPKPLDKNKLLDLLTNYGLMDPNDTETVQIVETDSEKQDRSNIFDSLREKLNIAAGVTASRMAEILNLFITMPVPDVKLKKGLEVTRDIVHWLNMRDSDNQKNHIIVSQGFVGDGVLGENLLYFSPEDMNNYTHLVCDTKTTYEEKVGIMIDLAGLISGTFIRVLATQFNTVIRTTHPALVPNILIDESFILICCLPTTLLKKLCSSWSFQNDRPKFRYFRTQRYPPLPLHNSGYQRWCGRPGYELYGEGMEQFYGGKQRYPGNKY